MARSSTPRSSAPRKPRVPRSAVPAPRLVPRRTPDTGAIALRAYEIFVESGCVHGCDIEHWLRAERELTEQLLTSAA